MVNGAIVTAEQKETGPWQAPTQAFFAFGSAFIIVPFKDRAPLCHIERLKQAITHAGNTQSAKLLHVHEHIYLFTYLLTPVVVRRDKISLFNPCAAATLPTIWIGVGYDNTWTTEINERFFFFFFRISNQTTALYRIGN